MAAADASSSLLHCIVERVNIGVFAVDAAMQVLLWNRFMEINSGRRADEVIGRNLFECFPELPRVWLEKKISNVLLLNNFAFTCWEQRPYLFRFPHHRPVTGAVECMRQNCTFFPVKNAAGAIEAVCITLADMTDTSIYHQRLSQAMQSLYEASLHDGLTGVYNRLFLEQSLGKEFSRVRRYGGELSLIMLDLDHFKAVNDDFGHLAGDAVLRTVASTVGAMLRDTDTFGRYGGEEFAIILPQTAADGAALLAGRICAAVADHPVLFEGWVIPITLSAGLAQAHPGMARYEELIGAADAALYRSKARGRNRVTAEVAEGAIAATS